MEFREDVPEILQEWIRNLPTLETLKGKLERLKKMDFSSKSVEQIGETFWEETGLVTTTFSSIDLRRLSRLSICRARKNVQPNEDASSISPFTYLPPNCAKVNQRGTIIGSSAFFGATDVRTTALEVGCKKGDVVYIGFWKIQCPTLKSTIEVNHTPLLPVNIPQDNPWYHHAQNVGKHFSDLAIQASVDKSAQIQFLLEFTADFFSREEPPYPLASWLGDNIFEKNAFSQFIIYPSYKTDRVSSNIVFRRSFVDDYFLLDRVYKYRIQSAEEILDWNSVPFEVGVNQSKFRDVHLPDVIKWRKYTEKVDRKYVANFESQNHKFIKG